MHYYSDAKIIMEIGDTFDFGEHTFEVCEAQEELCCEGCYFNDNDDPCPRCSCAEKIFKVFKGEED